LADTPGAFWATYEDEVDQPESWWRAFIDSGAWFLAHEGSAVVGIAAGLRIEERAEHHLISMWVSPSARRQGAGTGLVGAVSEWASIEGAAELKLGVTDLESSGFRLYEKCGFRLTGRSEPLTRDPSLVEKEMVLAL
jgi:GNAT superfamily N-acetyltransferase